MKLVARACFEWALVSISKPFSGFGLDIMLSTHKACVCVSFFRSQLGMIALLPWITLASPGWSQIDDCFVQVPLGFSESGAPLQGTGLWTCFLVGIAIFGYPPLLAKPNMRYKLYIYIHTEYNYKPFHKLCTIHYNHGPCKSTDHVLKIFDWDDREPGRFVGYVFPYSRFFLMYHVGNYINIFYTIWFYPFLDSESFPSIGFNRGYTLWSLESWFCAKSKMVI